ncbi:hypothetical protein [Dyadobacter luticola]|uniref:Uncharacterized protein n=1 Tax=Dyadobacter luticola TaxID=1979387 RepID=A0A5R9L1H4_9BACT|nr:hypothetical protein [Dyadobacter luticola]TLV02227.1 hypothetical protein FEN17_00880 [Dyadobacter luticola]
MRSKILPFAISLLYLLFITKDLSAQVKIGTNPTVIESNSNLEVEASTTGRKFKVDKATGKITIADGTQTNFSVLTSDADGKASWTKLSFQSFGSFPRMMVTGATTGELTDGVRVNLTYPNIQIVMSGFTYQSTDGQVRAVEGSYIVETFLTIENSEGCTGTSVMGLEVELMRNGEVIDYPILDEKLTPVYHDKYITKVSEVIGLVTGDYVSFSILPTIKSPQAGCTIKVTKGDLKMTYIP